MVVPTALDLLVENRITGFPVIDDDWKLVSRYCAIPDTFFEMEKSFDCRIISTETMNRGLQDEY